MSPIYSGIRIARNFDQDTALDFYLSNDDSKHTRVFFKGEIFNALIYKLAQQPSSMASQTYNDWFVFGNGPHRCPGEKLAEQEIKCFILTLLKNYTINTPLSTQPETIGAITQQFNTPIYVTLSPR